MLTKNDLLVLGLLLDRPMHGYEIVRHIRSEGVTTWFDISAAAIYYSLNKLREQRLVSETHSRSGGEKSVYRVTDRGRERFFAGMEEALASEELVRHDYDLNIYLLNRLPQERALPLLQRRWDFLSKREDELDETLQRERLAGEPLRVAILEHAFACTRVEAQWLGGIIRHLRGETAEGQEYQGLMLLCGDLSDFHLPDLIKLIASGAHSGTLTVSDGASRRTLSFLEGRPVCATSSRPDSAVGERGDVLDDIYDLFRWEEGAFALDQGMVPEEGCTVLGMSVADLILEGTRWVDNWSTIQQAVSTPDTVFERREDGARHRELDLNEAERNVLRALDGLSDVSDVARLCGLTEFETSKVLYSLSTVGLVQPGDRGKARLRRVFREFAELMCQSTLPHRDTPGDESCEREVNRRCEGIPIRFISGRIADQTEPGVGTEELAEAYRTFLRAQHQVLHDRFGGDIVRDLVRQVIPRISPGLRDALEEYGLTAFD
jgi:DNA-binding PadR family transcriptional regulator